MEHLSIGGVVVFDDFTLWSRGARKAMEDFFRVTLEQVQRAATKFARIRAPYMGKFDPTNGLDGDNGVESPIVSRRGVALHFLLSIEDRVVYATLLGRDTPKKSRAVSVNVKNFVESKRHS